MCVWGGGGGGGGTGPPHKISKAIIKGQTLRYNVDGEKVNDLPYNIIYHINYSDQLEPHMPALYILIGHPFDCCNMG